MQSAQSLSDIVSRRNSVVARTSVISSSSSQIRSGYSFPDIGTVESRIGKGDIAYLRGIIDDAIGSGNNCKSIADFLSQVLSRIQGQITILSGKSDALRK